MPSPVFIKQLALTRFQGFQIKLPGQAAVAPGGGLTLTKGTVGTTLTRAPSGFTTAKIGGTAPMAVPAALFLAASTSVGDVATQKAMHERYTQLFDGLSEVIRFAWDRFDSRPASTTCGSRPSRRSAPQGASTDPNSSR